MPCYSSKLAPDRRHHDQNTPADSLSGVRLYTFFIYIGEPDEGGHTAFPRLGLRVLPKKGSALLWANVLNHDPRQEDLRTEHEAEPPTRGQKLGANLWLHQYDFRGPNNFGCDMDKRVARGE